MMSVARFTIPLLSLYFLIASPDAFSDESPVKKATAAGDEALRVMTFNIRYDNPHDGEDGWPNRREKAASMVRFHQAVFAGLQEVQPVQVRDLQTLLPEWKWIGMKVRDKGENAGERVPILYRPERVELLDEGHFWLSEMPDVEESKGWDSAIARVAVWGKFRDRRTGKVFYVFNTHFDHIGETARVESAKLMKTKAAALAGDLPVIIMGDMNCRDTEKPYDEFVGKTDDTTLSSSSNGAAWRLHDSKDVSLHPHHGPTSTFQGFKNLPRDYRIDYIFVTPNVKVQQHATLSDRWDNARWPSDHLPVMAEITLD